jgi:hypothetical protein
MLRIAVAIACLLFGIVTVCADPWWSESYGRPTEAADSEQHKAAGAQEPPADHHRGTQGSPFIVKVLDPPNGDSIAQELAKDRDERASNDTATLRLTIMLVIVGLIQAGAIIYTALVTNKVANATKTAAEALPILERAYIFMVPIFSLSPPLEFPPVTRLDTADNPPPPQTFIVDYYFINHGKTPAIIKRIQARCAFAESIHTELGVLHTILINDDVALASGARFPRYASLHEERDWNSGDNEKTTALNNGDIRFRFWGVVVYDDIFGKEHVTIFNWAYSMMTGQFFASGGAPYNQRT